MSAMETLPPPMADRPALVFDDVVIDFQGRRLLRAGEVRPLEHKAFDVLALLTGRPGQVFARDDILDAVWGHRHVTPGVLNRVMTLLRQALGEDAHAPRYLRTLHGVGYRFDLPDAAGAPVPEAPVDDRRRAGARRKADTSESTPATGPTGIRSRRWLGSAAIALFACVLATAGWWLVRPHAAAPVQPEAAATSTPTLVVMPLKPIGSDDREIAAGLSDELISAVAKIDGLRVIARESTGVAAAQSSDVAALVPRLGITHALEGSLRQSGQQLRINLRLTDARSGRTLWTQDYDRNVADVFVLEREIAGAVANALTLQFGLPASRASRGGDADYLRRYQKTRALLNRSDTGDETEQAETEFRVLATQRPDDARAHAGLAEALNQRAFDRPALAAALRAEALQEATLAIRLDPGLPEPYGVQAGAACRNNRWERCLSLYRKSMAMAPSEAISHFQYAVALARLGYLAQAHAALQRDLARDPLNHAWHFADGRVLDTLGEYTQAQRAYARAPAYNPYGPWFNAVMRRDYAAAQHIAESMDDNPRDRLHGPLLKRTYLATTSALVDPSQWPQARAASRVFETETGLTDMLRVLHPDPDAAALIRDLESTQHRSYSTWDLLLWSKSLGYLRRDPAFGDYLRRNGILAYWQRHGFPPQCRAQRDGAVCE